MDIAFIGLGRMGAPMAANLLAAGHQLRVHDEQQDASHDLVCDGAEWAASPAAAVAQADVVLTCLRGPADVQLVAQDLSQAMRAGSTWIDCTTSSPQLIRDLAPAFTQRGIGVLDAPVSGGPAGAAGRRLVFWVGGEAATFEHCKDVLACMADETLHVGALGCGLVTKLAHNCANFAVQAVLAEAFTLGVKAGVDPLVLFTALRRGSLGRKSPVDRLAEQFLPGVYEPAAMTLALANKDLLLALSLARDEGVPLRLVEAASKDFEEAMRRGWAGRDARIALSLQEERSGVSVRVDAGELRHALGGPS